MLSNPDPTVLAGGASPEVPTPAEPATGAVELPDEDGNGPGTLGRVKLAYGLTSAV